MRIQCTEILRQRPSKCGVNTCLGVFVQCIKIARCVLGISLWTFLGGRGTSLGDGEREAKIGDFAKQYYKTICAAVKAVDPNHLIFGDRFNGNKGIPDGVLDAMKDHVDVLSVQYFCEPSKDSKIGMVEDLKGWSERCGRKPVLVADIGNWCATEMNPKRKSGLRLQKERGEDYIESGRLLLEQPWCIDWHWCGYIENRGGRGWGIIDPYDEPYTDMTVMMKSCHKEVMDEVEKS
jgi:hypothetical protein